MHEDPGTAIRRLRSAQGVSLRTLAADIGVSPATLSAIENGKTRMSVQRLQDLASALGLNPGQVLEKPRAGDTPDPESSRQFLSTEDWRVFEPLPFDTILASAVAEFTAIGYHGATMRSIADRAGLSVAGVYHHYVSKQDLLVRILDFTMEDLLWRMESAGLEGEAHDPAHSLRLMVEALTLFHTLRKDVSFIGASEMRSLESEHYRRIADLRKQVQLLLDDAIEAGTENKSFVTPSATEAGRAISSMCVGITNWFHPNGPLSAEQTAHDYAEFALSMLQYRSQKVPDTALTLNE